MNNINITNSQIIELSTYVNSLHVVLVENNLSQEDTDRILNVINCVENIIGQHVYDCID